MFVSGLMGSTGYPTTEFDYNKENVEEAIQRQFAGDDDVNAIMWLLQ